MEGLALNWLQWVEARPPFTSWEMFKDELLERFLPWQGSAHEELMSLRQPGPVAKYRKQFELLSAPLRDMSDELLKEAFINGLSKDIKAEVRLIEPKRLAHVMSLAQKIEDKNLAIGSVK